MTPRQPLEGLAFGCSLLLACGTEQIELRPGVRAPDPSAPSALAPLDAGTPTGSENTGGTLAPGRDGVLLPVDQQSGAPPEPAAGCQKIDFLFAIDNSTSMSGEQANLIRSFPGFIQVMQQVLGSMDSRIMVVSTGGDRENEGEPTLDPERCEEIQGAGKRRSPDGADCGMRGGLPFMAGDQPDLEATFSCVARVGTDGSAIEKPMDAILAATSESLNARGHCNDGFLREDAILVVTLITDADDRRSTGDPEDWRRLLLGAKGGNEDALVVLGLVGDSNVVAGLLGGQCGLFEASAAPRLQALVSSVDGVLGSVCAPDYAPFFQTAVGTIDSACSDFVPPVIF
jgi:hypothetical protein